jgi:hypothetical protein
MRNRILTAKEKELLNNFLNEQKTPETFRMLKLRIKRNFAKLTEDYELLKKSYEKFQKTPI